MQLNGLDWEYIDERAGSFTGRAWVFDQLQTFLQGPVGTYIVVGPPGAGKTAVAARIAQASTGRWAAAGAIAPAIPEGTLCGAVFCRAEEVVLLDIAQRLCGQLTLSVPGFADALRGTLAADVTISDVLVTTGNVASGARITGVNIALDGLGDDRAFTHGVVLPLRRMRERGFHGRIVLLVDAVDEALAAIGARSLPRLLTQVPGAHLIVTARPDHRVLAHFGSSARRLDLLADAPPREDDVYDYARGRVEEHGAASAMTLLAKRIARASERNFLYAVYVCDALIASGSLRGITEDGAALVALPAGGLAGVYEQFLARELTGDEDAWAERLRPILGPIAVGLGDGLDTAQLGRIGTRVAGRTIGRSQARDVTRRAGQFLQGRQPDGPFRPYHQSFARFLTDPVQNPNWLVDAAETHEAVVDALIAAVPDDGLGKKQWSKADPYTRSHIAMHAAQCGQLDRLLEDVGFLTTTRVGALLPLLSAVRGPDARRTARIFRLAAHDMASVSSEEDRASYLELTAHKQGARRLANSIAEAYPRRGWEVRWAQWRRSTGHYVISAEPEVRQALTVARVEGRTLVVCGAGDGTLGVWDVANGELFASLPGAGDPVLALAVAQIGGRPVAIAYGPKMGLRLWDISTAEVVGDWADPAESAPFGVGDLQDGPIVVHGGREALTAWDLVTGEARWRVPCPASMFIRAVAAGSVRCPFVVAGGEGGAVWVWDLDTGEPVRSWSSGQGDIYTVAVTYLNRRAIAIAGGQDGTLGMWDVASGRGTR